MNIDNFNIYHASVVSVILAIGLLVSGCESKEKNLAQNSVEAESSQVSGPTKIGAFILNAENSAKLFEQGAKLAVSNSPSSSFELKFFNAEQGNSSDASSLKSLIEKDKAPAVIYWTVDDVSMVAPYLNSSNAVGLVAGEVSKKVTRLGANIYGFGYSSELTFKQMAMFAGNTLKSYRIGVVSASESRFDLQSKVFVEETKSLGNTIVFDEKVSAEVTDFNSLIVRAKSENCDTIFTVLPSHALVQFIKAIRANQFEGKLLVGDTLFAPELAALGQEAEGIYMAQAWSDDLNLKTLYSTKYGSSTDGVSLGFVALGYDTAMCLQGIGAPLDAYSMKNSLLSKSCEGLTGKTQFTGERIAQRRKQILTVKNGQFVLVE